MKHETIARLCHEVNRAYCQALGDDSQLPWDEAPEHIKQSVLRGVQVACEYPDITPAEQHAAWLAYKSEEGWTYGPVKDSDKREHPCMVPYDQLPQAQQVKDHLFGAIVRTMAGPA